MHSRTVPLTAIDEGLSTMRLTRPEQVTSMQQSLGLVGQLQPVILRVCPEKDTYQLLDGFKRYYAGQALQWPGLDAHLVEVDDITAKAMILSYNQQGNALIDYEEAQIVYSLKAEHLMSQEEIASLLSRSTSWVSRRLSFIERLDEGVRGHLQLGKITPTHARELVKLPRGKQSDFLAVIIGHNLTSRQSSLLINKYLQARTKEEQDYLMNRPLQVIERATLQGEVEDSRLGGQGNRLLKTTRILAHQQHIFIGAATNPPLKELADEELDILSAGFRDIVKKIKTIHSILKPYDNHER